MAQTDSPVWLITGCSTGFGRELAQAVSERGLQVAATARKIEHLEGLLDKPEQGLKLPLDVTQPKQIDETVDAVMRRFGRIDVLVNNAGYGYQASVEEAEDSEIRAQFETNVFGLFALTRAVLPHMRAQRSGCVMNITSVAGLIGFPGSGYYSASKHAVEGWSDSLAAEVAPIGVKVICVEPGPFRTDWAGRSLKQTPSKIEDYAATVRARLKATSETSGTQPGDPRRAAETMIDLAKNPNAPRRIVFGAFGVEAVSKKLTDTLDDIRRWRDVSLATDFPR